MRELLDLLLVFAKIGAVTFGGGYAMLPILQRELVEKRGWVTDEEIMDYFAIGQCTPGIIAVNTATFVGIKRRGVPGAVFATAGIVLPSLVIITVLAAFLANFAEYALVKNAFAGIRVCVCVLIANAVIKLWKKAVVDLPTLLIFLLVFGFSFFTDVTPVLFVVLAAAAGIAIKVLGAKKEAAK
ncbi:MAG: chromate transporter [Eubacteriales bacterium]|nr:chromate transporter [Eubacteriales bacterium]